MISQMNHEILRNEPIADGIFRMEIIAPEIAEQAQPGQFVNLYTEDGGALLPRPISLCGTDKNKGTVTLVYRVNGHGTELFSGLGAGKSIKVMGPLGNGFPLDIGGTAAIVGGGVGIPPLLGLCASLQKASEIKVFLGYKDSQTFLLDDFKALGVQVLVASDDGSAGFHGNSVDLFKAQPGYEPDAVYACGPEPMLRALVKAADNLFIYVSAEERMACGFGACLGCAIKARNGRKRVCKDGPVFNGNDVYGGSI